MRKKKPASVSALEVDPVPVPDPVPVLPSVTLSVPPNFTAHLDHRPISSSTLSISDRTPHLIRLRPAAGEGPEITLRLTPTGRPAAPWRATIRSVPWMQLKLNKRPAGQTPKSGLLLPKGPSTLVLSRDAVTVRLALETRE